MRSLILALVLLVPVSLRADILNKCLVVREGTINSTGASTIVPLPELEQSARNSSSFTGVLAATNTTGTTPTLNVTLQSCKDLTTASCKDTPVVFTQCTTGSCSEYIDLNKSLVNLFPYFRINSTIGGTSSPAYTAKVELCYN